MKCKVFTLDYYENPYDYRGDNYTELLKGITSWEDISEEDAKILSSAGYLVVRQYTQEEICSTVAKLLDEYHEKQKRIKKQQEEYKAQVEANKQKALARKLAKAKKLLEEHSS